MTVKKRTLEIKLDKLEKPESPKADLEQYTTPADVASDLLWTALSFGDIQGRKVADLGCGNGILGIGASLLGAEEVTCYDVDPGMVKLTERNAASISANIVAVCSDVESISERYQTVVQNPPFGAQRSAADRPFLRTTIRISEVAYSLHMAETTGFVAKFCGSFGAEVQHIKSYKFKIPFMFEFHSKPEDFVEVALLRIITRG